MTTVVLKASHKDTSGAEPHLAALRDRQAAGQLGVLHIHVLDEGAIQDLNCHVSVLLVKGLDQHLQGLYLKSTNSE